MVHDDFEELELEAETLAGDIRDELLGFFREMVVGWSFMSEREQKARIELADQLSKRIIRRTLALLAEEATFPTIDIEIGSIKIDKRLEIKINAAIPDETLVALVHHRGRHAQLVLADAEQFFGERAPARPQPDQPSFPGT